MFSFNHIRTIGNTLQLFLKYGVPDYILSFGDSFGDNLLLTTLAKALNRKGQKKIWIKCNHYELFKANPDILLVVPFNARLSTLILNIAKVRVASPSYTFYQKENDQDLIPDKHIILKMADCLDLRGAIDNKPVLLLNDAEEKKGWISPNQIVIITSSSSLVAPMRNKEWFADRYQQIVNTFAGDYNFIQLGSTNDVGLNNVIDLRGKTTIRESAAILKKSLLMLGHVGFMMHLARAVDCRAVVVFGGRESPDQSGYACFHNIYMKTECSPCWLRNDCKFERKCMTSISVDIVEDAMLKQLRLIGNPLENDLLYN